MLATSERRRVGIPSIITIVTDYDPFALAYSEHNESSSWNARYERPAVLAMVGDVAGKDVLDVGCGSGIHAAALSASGARVIGVDLSAGLLELARERLGDGISFHRADLALPLPFDDESFDVVLASLVLHYLRDWEAPLAELHRVLRPGGRLVASTHHPFMDHVLSGGDDYFATLLMKDEWELDDRRVTVEFWRRPLRAMIHAFTAAGFHIVRIEEPDPDPLLATIDPDAYRTITTKPQFLFFELVTSN